MIRKKKKKRRVAFSFLHSCAAVLLKRLRMVLLLLALVSTIALGYYTYARRLYHTRFLLAVEEPQLPAAGKQRTSLASKAATAQRSLETGEAWRKTNVLLGIRSNLPGSRGQPVKSLKVDLAQGNTLEVSAVTSDQTIAKLLPERMFEAFRAIQDERILKRRKEAVRGLEHDLGEVTTNLKNASADQDAQAKERAAWEKRVGYADLLDAKKQLKPLQERLGRYRKMEEALKNPDFDLETKRGWLGKFMDQEKAAWKNEPKPERPKTPKPGIPEVPSKKDPIKIALEEKLLDLQTTLDIRMRILRRDHPDILEVKKQIAEIEKKLKMNLNLLEEDFRLRSKLLKQKAELLEAKAEMLSGKQKQLRDLERGAAKIDKKVDDLKARFNRLKADIEAIGSQVIHPDVLLLPPETLVYADSPITPNLSRVILTAIAAALLLGIGLPFALEYMDNTLTVAEDAEEILEMPSLGIVPRIPHDELPGMLDEEDEDEEESQLLLETFRMLRTNLITATDQSNPRQIIMVTSSVPQEGKSTVAYNLARSFARLGEKTLLADLDLRRGHLHEFFDQTHQPGVTEMITTANINLADYVRTTEVTGLSFLPGGKRIENVSEMLATEAFSGMIDSFRETYGRIILDTPPALGLAETSGLLPLVDGVVLVIWSGYAPAPHVQSAVNILRQNGARFLGFVLNQVDMKCPTNYFRYYYYSDYYYSSYHE